MSPAEGRRGSGLRTYFGGRPDLGQILYFTVSENAFRTKAMSRCSNCGNRAIPPLSMMIASGFFARQSANLFATSTMVRPANLISLSRIIAAGRATVERPR